MQLVSMTEMKNIFTNILTAAVMVAGLSATVQAADRTDPVSKLFAGARAQSSQLSVDWKYLSRRTGPNPANDAAEILRMKQDVNAAEKTIAALNDSRREVSPSQSAAIDRIVPVMEEIAGNTADAIEFLSSNQPRMTAKEYRAYVSDGSDTSHRLSSLIAELVDYASHKTKFDEAKRSLELASN